MRHLPPEIGKGCNLNVYDATHSGVHRARRGFCVSGIVPEPADLVAFDRRLISSLAFSDRMGRSAQEAGVPAREDPASYFSRPGRARPRLDGAVHGGRPDAKPDPAEGARAFSSLAYAASPAI